MRSEWVDVRVELGPAETLVVNNVCASEHVILEPLSKGLDGQTKVSKLYSYLPVNCKSSYFVTLHELYTYIRQFRDRQVI